VSEWSFSSVFLFNSVAARKACQIRNSACRFKLILFSHGCDDVKREVFAHHNIGSDDLDALQIFLPWSWSNRHPEPVLSSCLETLNDPNYFPYNKYIFNRAVLSEEERQETKCLCLHFLPCPQTRPVDCWYDWPCGCSGKVGIFITADVLELYPASLVTQVSNIQLDQAYIVYPESLDNKLNLVRFSVPPRKTTFPVKRRRKRKSTSGRKLSLTDRKHYKRGRSNFKT